MAIHIAVTTGETVTPAELLGDGEQEKASRMTEAEKHLAELEKRTGHGMLPAGERMGEMG